MMDVDDYYEYWKPAAQNIFGIDGRFSTDTICHLLDKALGTDEFDQFLTRASTQDKPIEDYKLKTLLISLAGPYGKIILKAYQIKQGIDWKMEPVNDATIQRIQSA